jgi:IPT/TIG domain
MLFRIRPLPFLSLLGLLILSGCNNTLNPLCGSARPAPMVGSLAPSAVSFSEVQRGAELIVNGSNFVSSSEVMLDSTPLSTTVLSSTQLKVMLTTGVISAPGSVKVAVVTPGGNTANLGCTSGGKSSALILTVN